MVHHQVHAWLTVGTQSLTLRYSLFVLLAFTILDEMSCSLLIRRRPISAFNQLCPCAFRKAADAYSAFRAFGFLSRFILLAFVLFALFGIAFPLLWAKVSGDWRAVGFTKRNLGKALLWGLGTGLAWGAYTYIVLGECGRLPPLWGLQAAIAFPIWLLVWSPSQEFFF